MSQTWNIIITIIVINQLMINHDVFQEPNQESPFGCLNNQGSVCDLTLYSSPSLPNISLGRPHVLNSNANVSNFNS